VSIDFIPKTVPFSLTIYILVDKSLLNRTTETELQRDFFELFARDENGLVYLDYLRELFHLIVLGENKRIVGERETDFGVPIEFFEAHKKAMLAQMHNALKEEGDKREDILGKYFALSKYHNSTIDSLRQTIVKVSNTTGLFEDLFEDQMRSIYSKKLGLNYSPKYSAEDYPEQSDMLNIVGTVINRIIGKHREDNATIEEAIRAISAELPIELLKLGKALDISRIDAADLPGR